jgi:excinuclease UvrABC helicase subunit UvrB
VAADTGSVRDPRLRGDAAADLMNEVRERVDRNERILVTTLTKR